MYLIVSPKLLKTNKELLQLGRIWRLNNKGVLRGIRRYKSVINYKQPLVISRFF